MNMFSFQLQLLSKSINNPDISGREQRIQNAKTNIQERRQLICDSIEDLGPASVRELIADTGLSEASIANHTSKMEKENILVRINGCPIRFDIKRNVAGERR